MARKLRHGYSLRPFASTIGTVLYHRIWNRYWWVLFPLSVLLIEFSLSRGLFFHSAYVEIAYRDQPALLINSILWVGTKLILVYWISASLVEWIAWILARAVSRKFWLIGLRSFLFLAFYLAWVQWAISQFPAWANLYSMVWFRAVHIAFLILVLGISLWEFYRKLKPQPPLFRNLLLRSIVLFTFLLLFVKDPWQTTQAKAIPKSSAPNLVFLGWDAIPQALWVAGEPGSWAAPQWQQQWKQKGTHFPKAFSATNSTYTSWISILSGLFPFESGVRFLYPSKRYGNLQSKQFLSKWLQQREYRTVFMTDCASTSWMTQEMGWDELLQVDKGVLSCGEIAALTRHPLTPFWAKLLTNAFPERLSRCSYQYESLPFFRMIHSRIDQSDRKDQPLFLAVHSCLTHQESIPRYPPIQSPYRKSIPFSVQDANERRFLMNIREADDRTAELLNLVSRKQTPYYVFLFSDHGSRVVRGKGGNKHFSHAVGLGEDPMEFHVPLSIWNFGGAEPVAGEVEREVYLTELNGTVKSIVNSHFQGIKQKPAWVRKGLDFRDTLSSALPLRLERDIIQDLIPEVSMDEKGALSFSVQLEDRLSRNLERLN